MSIAAISQSFATTLRAVPDSTPTEPERAAPRASREQGRRHELVDAMNSALGLTGGQAKEELQAVFHFAQTLMHDLRALDASAESEDKGQGSSWSRRDWGDLAQRLTALAAAASNPGVPAAATPPAADVSTPAPQAVPDTPSPVTPATVAVYIMKVPTSHLMGAYVAMQRALGLQEPSTAAEARSGLAALATELAAALRPDAKAALPPGSVLNVSA